MNLKEALKNHTLDQFIKEHEIADPHPDGESRFSKLVDLMAGSLEAVSEALDEALSEDCDETQTRRGSSKDV